MGRATSTDPVVGDFLAEHGHESAFTTTTAWQRLKFAFWAVQLFILFNYDWKIFFTILTGVLCVFYLVTIMYKLLTVLVSVVSPGDIRVSAKELGTLTDSELPVYTVLVPLYKEAEIADRIVESMSSLDYPQEKLDVILLLEEDDKETRAILEGASLPPFIRTLVVPDGIPKTKPRACMHGLRAAKGEYLVIYDAEDRPEPDQLKKAAYAFQQIPKRVMCLQAKLNYYNPRQNWLTKWFTIEYTTWFDLFLPGLNRLGMPIPLGGTSNHFRTAPLREVGGWDPFNVAEDCDLGIRLHKAGHRTKVLDSTTWEEANSSLGNWIRQRSRWVKGYVQTHLVHTRESLTGARIALALALGAWLGYGIIDFGMHLVQFVATRSDVEKRLASEAAVLELQVVAAAGAALLIWGYLKRVRRFGLFGQTSFLLTVGGLSLTLLLNPIFWCVGIAWLYWRWRIWYPTSYYDDAMLNLNYWSVASHWFWVISVVLLLANVALICVHLLACWRRKLKDLVGYAFLAPFYWVLISVGAWRGFLQLFTRAHYWDKTVHGLGGAPPEGFIPGGARAGGGLHGSTEDTPPPGANGLEPPTVVAEPSELPTIKIESPGAAAEPSERPTVVMDGPDGASGAEKTEKGEDAKETDEAGSDSAAEPSEQPTVVMDSPDDASKAENVDEAGSDSAAESSEQPTVVMDTPSDTSGPEEPGADVPDDGSRD